VAPIGIMDGGPEVRALQVFESATGKPAGPEMDLSGMLVSAAFSPDGRLIAGLTGIGQDPRQLRIWDWRTGTQVCPPFALDSEPVWVAYAPDGKAVAIHCIDGKVALVDPATGRAVLRAQCAERRAGGYTRMSGRGTIRFSRDGRTLFTWGSPVVEAWDRATGKVRYAVKQRGDCWALAESPDSRLLATAWSGGGLLFTNSTDGKETRPPIIHPDALVNVVFSPDGRMVCTAGGDQQLRIWSVTDGTLVSALSSEWGTLSDASFTPDGRWAVMVTYGTYRLWDWKSGFPITPDTMMTQDMTKLGYHAALDTSADGHWLAVSGSEGNFPIIDLIQLTTPSARSPDDLLAWCELLSAMRVSGTATVGLTDDEWLLRWRQYEARHPEVRFPVK
jgi:WD40 repeat protein